MSIEEQRDIVPADDLLAGAGPGLDWFSILHAVLRGKRLALLLGILFSVVTWLVLLKVPNRFQATSELLPPQVARISSAASMLSQGGIIGDATLLSGLGSSIQAKSQADLFALILGAWPTQDALVHRFNLQQIYKARNDEAAREMVGARTVIKATKEGVIDIMYTDTDPQRAADIANAYVEETRNLLRGMALSEASQKRVFYENQLSKTKIELANAEIAFKHVQQQNGMVALDTQAKTLIERSASLRSQVTAKEVEVQSLRGYLTESNPELQIAETELTALRGKVTELDSQGQGGYSGRSLSSVPDSELDFVRATRELKYQEALYDLMVKQYEGSRIDEAKDAPVIQVIAPALVPDRKVGPHKVQNAAIGFLFGIFCGIMISLYHYWKSTLTKATADKLSNLSKAAWRWG